ncbi:cytochrome aa3 quinol oxidase subunit IV [Priestia megaterium]|uniref:cytochrome aa3 quinol oxidase subunit IV n=1 Tax=Priestia megaterium TaxID=1404 RepID=UPI002E23D121|nr:cytochrome aa3 quinol oxidase subunit IV [Priestia megaterium]
MKGLFPFKQVAGFIFSLILTGVALLVYFADLSFNTGITILLITAFAQALLQLVVFMHAGETKDKWSIYGNVYFMMFIALATIFGSLLIFLWDM